MKTNNENVSYIINYLQSHSIRYNPSRIISKYNINRCNVEHMHKHIANSDNVYIIDSCYYSNIIYTLDDIDIPYKDYLLYLKYENESIRNNTIEVQNIHNTNGYYYNKRNVFQNIDRYTDNITCYNEPYIIDISKDLRVLYFEYDNNIYIDYTGDSCKYDIENYLLSMDNNYYKDSITNRNNTFTVDYI